MRAPGWPRPTRLSVVTLALAPATLCRLLYRPCPLGAGRVGIGGDGPLRLFVTALQYPDGNHLFALAWEGSSAADLLAFGALTQPILDSIRVPDRYVRN